jgi:hypothetical protein
LTRIETGKEPAEEGVPEIEPEEERERPVGSEPEERLQE